MAKYLFLEPLRFLAVESFFMRRPLGVWFFHNLMRAARLGGRIGISRERLLKRKFRMRLRYLNVEFTSHCNLRCKWCSLDSSRPKGFMKLSLWEYIVDYLVEKIGQGQISIGELALHHGGETLLHPKVGRMLFYLGKARENVPNFPFVTLLTNASVLNRRMSNIILASGGIDYMRFSIDGGTKDSFESIRRGAKWESVLNNVNYFLTLNRMSSRKVRTGIIMIDTGQKLSNEFAETVRMVDDFRPREAHNWDGAREFVDLSWNKKPRRGLCDFIEDDMAILWDGRVVPCCNDLNGRGIIGDLNTETLIDIYSGAKRRNMMSLMRQKKRHQIRLCKQCSL